MQVIVESVSGRSFVLFFDGAAGVDAIKQRVHEADGIPVHLQRVSLKCANNDPNTVFARVSLPLLGGKGGFGSLLRGASTKVGQKKTSNYGACRDLSGRRIRHVDDEKSMNDFRQSRAQAPVDHEAIQRQFREIRSGRKDLRRMCKFAADCRYKEDCRYRHPDEDGEKEDLSSVGKRSHFSAFGARDTSLDIPSFCDAESVMASVEAGIRLSKARRKKSPISADDDTGSSAVSASSPASSSNDDKSPVNAEPSSSSLLASSPSSNNACARTCSRSANIICLQEQKQDDEDVGINLQQYDSAVELEQLGLDRLKAELMRKGLKCGGTLQQRCERLFLLKHTPLHLLASKHFAKRK